MIGPDPRQLVELLDGRGREADGPADRAFTTRRLTGPGSAGCCAARHEDLDPVHQRSGEIHRREVGITGRATCAVNGVGDARTVAQSIEPGPAHLADDVDDEHGTRRRRSDGLELGGDGFRLARRSGLRETLADQGEHGQRDADSDDRGRAGEGDGHDAIVAARRSHVVHDSVERLQRRRPRNLADDYITKLTSFPGTTTVRVGSPPSM